MKKSLALLVCLVLMGCVTEGEQAFKNSAPTIARDNQTNTMRPESDTPPLTKRRSNSQIHVELGQAYLSSMRLGVALDEAKIALAYDNTNALAHLLLAQTYARLGQFAEAAPSFAQAHRLASGDPEINNAYGWFLCSQGQERQGIDLLNRAATNPYYATPSWAYTNLGLCYIRLNDLTSAQDNLQRAVRLDANNQQALLLLSEIAYREGNYAGAQQWLKTLQKLPTARPTPEVLWLGLRIERKLNNQRAAAEYASRLRREFATSEEYKLLLQGKYE